MIHYYFASRKGTIEFSLLFKKGKYFIYVDLNVLCCSNNHACT